MLKTARFEGTNAQTMADSHDPDSPLKEGEPMPPVLASELGRENELVNWTEGGGTPARTGRFPTRSEAARDSRISWLAPPLHPAHRGRSRVVSARDHTEQKEADLRSLHRRSVVAEPCDSCSKRNRLVLSADLRPLGLA